MQRGDVTSMERPGIGVGTTVQFLFGEFYENQASIPSAGSVKEKSLGEQVLKETPAHAFRHGVADEYNTT